MAKTRTMKGEVTTNMTTRKILEVLSALYFRPSIMKQLSATEQKAMSEALERLRDLAIEEHERRIFKE